MRNTLGGAPEPSAHQESSEVDTDTKTRYDRQRASDIP
jgi:hypothetical protein